MIKSFNLSYFLSDVHLSDARPDITERLTIFFERLFSASQEPRNVFILGDLFDIWLGDDLHTPLISHITQLFQRCKAHHIMIYFMAGNRDYLLGKRFSDQANLILLPDPVIAILGDHPILLTHGDQFMTLDKKYMGYRSIAQHVFIKSNFPKLPLWLRSRFAHFLRNRSKTQNKKKLSYIMDVDPLAVIQWFDHYQVAHILHGHIHQMGIHHHGENKDKKRYVLGDWYTQGNYIQVDCSGILLKTF